MYTLYTYTYPINLVVKGKRQDHNMSKQKKIIRYCRTHNTSVCLYIAYIACGSTSLYIKTLYFFLTVLALSAAATVANIKICYDAKIPQLYMCSTVYDTYISHLNYIMINMISSIYKFMDFSMMYSSKNFA